MQDLNRLRIAYRREKGVVPRVAHGVYGGITQEDSIEMEFFSESEDLTGSMDLSYDPDGRPLPPDEPFTEGKASRVTRTIHSRILMNRATARNVANWLQEILDAMDEMEKSDEDRDYFEDMDESLLSSKRH